MSSSRRKKKKSRAQRPEQPFDLEAEVRRLIPRCGGDEESARIIAQRKAERLRLGMTPEEFCAYEEKLEAEEETRTKAEREARQKAEEEADDEPAPWDEDTEDEDDEDEEPEPRRVVKRRKAKKAQRTTEPDEPDDDWKEGFAAVPYPVIDKLLHAMHPGLLRVYLALLRHEGYESKRMYPGQERIAKLSGLADRQTRKYLHALRDVGLITIKRQGYYKGRENMPNLYHHLPVTRENWSEILTKLDTFSLPRMSKADRKRLSGTDRHR